MAITSRLVGKFGGGSDIQVHPVEVAYQPYGGNPEREVLKVHGEPGSQYLITIEGNYESPSSIAEHQIQWRTESSDWIRVDIRHRGRQTQVAVLAQGGDTLMVGRQSLYDQQGASFIGKAYVAPVPELSEEEGDTTTLPIGPTRVSGAGNTEHLVADLEVPAGEVWKVKVTGAYAFSGYINNNALPTVIIGSKQSVPVGDNVAIEVEAYVSTVSRISLVTNSTVAVTFEGIAEITPMKW